MSRFIKTEKLTSQVYDNHNAAVKIFQDIRYQLANKNKVKGDKIANWYDNLVKLSQDLTTLLTEAKEGVLSELNAFANDRKEAETILANNNINKVG